MYARSLSPQNHSFFLFGPRATGKTTWLREHYEEGQWFNLLNNQEYLDLLQDKQLFRRKVEASTEGWVVVDEVQRLPELLNEVHDLISLHGDRYRFALSGSSARKLRRGGVNLLAGRAITKNFFALTSREVLYAFDIETVLKTGMLPDVHRKPEIAKDILKSYVSTYLTQEIQQEALTRNLDSFSRFLQVAAQVNGEIINVAGLSRDAGVARTTCQNYFEILRDTLLGFMLPPWQPKVKVRERGKPKFYFFDTGVVNAIANDFDFSKRGIDVRGRLLETFILNELRAYASYSSKDASFHYWQGSSGKEVDIIIQMGAAVIGVEIKATKRWRSSFSAVLRELPLSSKHAVFMGTTAEKDGDVQVSPVVDFCRLLHEGKIF